MAVQFASRLALIAFATAAAKGLIERADFFGSVQNALIALGGFYILGLIIGDAARRLVEESVRSGQPAEHRA